MKKKVKKIPKYSLGTIGAKNTDLSIKSNPAGEAYYNKLFKDFNSKNLASNAATVVGATAPAVASALNIEQGDVAAIGNAIGDVVGVIPGIGLYLSAGIKTISSFAGAGGSVDENTGEVTKSSGLTRWLGFGRNDNALARKSNMIKNSIASKTQTQNLQADYYNNPNVVVAPNVLAAEGGIMRLPVDALVSKGELIYNPMTKKLSKVPGSKGKPNKADDVYARLYEGDVVISNSPTMLMANGKTPALNLEGLVDKYATGGTVKAREAIIKKVVNWQEANKTKPQEYAKFKDGWNGEIKTWDDYLKYQYNLSKNNKIDSLDNFWGYDSKNKKYTLRWDKIIKHIGENKELREKAIKDLSGLSYVGTGKDAWDNIVKAAYDTNPADVHRYFKSVGDVLLINEDALKPPFIGIGNVISVPKGISQKNIRSLVGVVDIMNRYVPQQESEKLIAPPLKKVSGLMDTYDEDIDDAYRSLRDRKRAPKLRQLGESMLDIAPLATALFGDYDYHREQAYINPTKYIPTGVSIEPIRRAANESYAMARYNQANISPNTGAGMAYGLQAASNRAKTLADAYTWQQDAQNKLIALNVGIYNDWAAREAQARHIANTETRQNEAAADYMRKTDIKSGLDWYQGRRRDRQILPALKQYLGSGMYQSTLDNLNV